MSIYGMDVEQGKALGKKLDQGADTLMQLSKELSSLLSSSPWDGPDAQGFKRDWNGHRQTLLSASNALHQASRTMKEQVRQQEQASQSGGGTSGGSGGHHGGLPGWLTGAGGWLLNDERSPLHNLLGAGREELDALGNFGRMGLDALIHGEPPSITQLVAGGLNLLGSSINLGVTGLTDGLVNPHIFDDGTPAAGDPHHVGVAGMHNSVKGYDDTPVPNSLSNIMSGVSAAYQDSGRPGTPDNAVRITAVDKHDGNGPAYIVSIPGTQTWNPLSGSTPMDLTGNLVTASGGMSTMSQAVERAMEKAGIPADAPVMLVGHSQGGMTAAALASDSEFRDRFNVTNVMTYGSPVDSTHIPDGIHTLEIQHATDVVPRLDLGNAKPGPGPFGIMPWARDNNGTVVTLPDPPGVGALDAAGNHDFNNYARSVADHMNVAPLANYQNDASMQRFITNDPNQVTATTSDVGRKM
ncbi:MULTISPECIES: hypothetical protein [Arthrobacter]|uniref:GPI inositol-deacylase PGAP1-like alpha/beta domain-containing protein n=2 Tax=Arthrobacter TaxID=1663 RepID=A0ABU9KJ69_9MICC|nr:hypothetical protein [Arthrobacter sp. YJM1]MDP5226551.1 hypothetical protein [Arthrobacter sp. YJM1]